MSTLTLEIAADVAEKFPDITVGGFVVHRLDEAAGRLPSSTALSETTARALGEIGLTTATVTEDSRIAAWRSAFAACLLKPSKYRSSVEALVRRSLKGDRVEVSPVVDLYCAVSAKSLAPLGGYDLDRLPSRSVSVRFARPAADRFNPLGGSAGDMTLSPSVVVYACGAEVICWGFNHRDSQSTCLTPRSRSAVFFSESVYSVHREPLSNALKELRATLVLAGASCGSVVYATGGASRAELDFY